jgi:hypothetical protein
MHSIVSPIIAPLAATLLLLSAATASAQTFTDDFSSNTNWSSIWAPPGATGDLAFSNSRLDYTSPSTGTAFAARWLTTYQAPTTSNWAVQIDVHMDNTETWSTSGGYAWRDLSLVVYNTRVSPSFSTPFSLFGATAERYESASTSNSFYGFAKDGSLDTDCEYTTERNNVANASLRLTYDAASKSLSAWYDANGAADGVTWVNIGSLTINSLTPNGTDLANWSMGTTDTFSFGLVGDAGISGLAEALSVGPGQAYFDHFTASGLTAVPEPSACTVLCGLLALGLVGWTRMRRRAATGS